jgi:lactoylglutathione lyase
MTRTVTFRDAFPILYVAEMGRSLRFYRDLLGFEVGYEWAPEGRPVFVALRLGASSLGLCELGEARPLGWDGAARGLSGEVCLYVDDVDGAAEWLRSQGVRQREAPADQPWGERLAYFEDPDGYPVHVTMPVTGGV